MVNPYSCRPAVISDNERLYEVEKAAWGDDATSHDVIEKRLKTNGLHTITTVDSNNRIMAFGQVKRLNWMQIKETGFIWEKLEKELPSENGNILYGLNISAIANRYPLALGMVTLESIFGLTISLNCNIFLAGGRLINFHKWSKLFRVEDYPNISLFEGKVFFVSSNYESVLEIGKKSDVLNHNGLVNINNSENVIGPLKKKILAKGKYLEPMINFYRNTRVGATSPIILGVIEDYFKDPLSLNYGVLIAWVNPFASEGQDLAAKIDDSINYIKS